MLPSLPRRDIVPISLISTAPEISRKISSFIANRYAELIADIHGEDFNRPLMAENSVGYRRIQRPKILTVCDSGGQQQ